MKFEYWFDKIIDKLERRFGRFAIPNLTAYVVGFNAFVYVLNYVKPGYIDRLALNMEKVLHGQVWRLFTYLFIPPLTDVIFIFFALYLLYLFGSGLETYWGSFRLNLYYLIGMISTTVISVFLPTSQVTNAFLNTSLFLAFAAVYPDFLLYIFFILPVKVKYLAAITWIGILLSIFFGPWGVKLLALVSVINYLLFFWSDVVSNVKTMYRGTRISPQPLRSKDEYFHKCSICGKTEKDDQNLEFRVCLDCEKEYCMEHLKEHKHG